MINLIFHKKQCGSASPIDFPIPKPDHFHQFGLCRGPLVLSSIVAFWPAVSSACRRPEARHTETHSEEAAGTDPLRRSIARSHARKRTHKTLTPGDETTASPTRDASERESCGCAEATPCSAGISRQREDAAAISRRGRLS